MEDVLFRLAIVWAVLHIILLFVEWYRYEHGNLSWYGFKNNGMLDVTYFILSIDELGGICGLVYWILQPVL